MKDSVIREVTSLWFVCALDVSVKALVLALIAAVLLKLSRIADPNLRHRVWTGILLAMLALPVLSQLLPSLRLPFAIDASWLLAEQKSITTTDDQAPQTPEAIPTELLAVDPGSVNMEGLNQTTGPKRLAPLDDVGARVLSEQLSRSPSNGQSRESDEREAATAPLSPETSVVASPTVASPAPGSQSKWIARMVRVVPPFLFLVWVAIAFLLFARLALALIGSYQLKRNSSSIALSDLSDLELPTELLHVRGKSLSLFECPQLKVPVTVGVLAPRVYLPTEWLEWANEKLVAVLTHERTHIERRDCTVIMLAELNRCLFWFHPLAWWLKIQLSALAEAACDDAVIGTTGDRTTYAKHLLEVASVVARQPGRVANLGVSMARCSNVETRIHSILDFTRPLSQKLTKWTSASLLLVIVPIVIVAASLQPSSQTGLLEPRAEPSALNTDDHEETRDTNPDELQSVDVRTSITIEGIVLKPDGTAAAGAAVRTHAWWWNWPSEFGKDETMPPIFETTTGSDGRFSLKLPFGPDEKLSDTTWKGVWSEPRWKRLWNFSAVVASMPGYGGSWVALEQLVPSESITLRLVNEHPIRGKIIDLEGKPIAGATIQISNPTDGKAGSLDAWLAGIRAGEPAWTVHAKAGTSIEPRLLGISDKMKSDADGRFEIRGLGPECKIDLAFVGETVAHREAIACTRKMEPITRVILPEASKQTEPVLGSDFIYSADPARVISGTVKDAATGDSLAGVSVEQGEEFVPVQQSEDKNVSGQDSKMKSQNANPGMKRLEVASTYSKREMTALNSTLPASIGGTVSNEASDKLSGVTVYMTGIQTVEIDGGYVEPKLIIIDKAISTTEGRFELKLPSDEKKLERLKILARAEGYGLQWREVPSVTIPESLDLVLPKLQPIRLRLVDIDGRPAQGVSLAVSVLMRAGASMNNPDFMGPYKDLPELTQLWPPSQKTDSDGRCQILNVGAGLGAYAQVEGNDLFAPQALMINSGEAEERGQNDGTYRAQVKNVAGDREVVVPLAPAQVFEGQITLADTGKPAAGVKVGVWASQQEFGSMVSVDGKTDEHGKYRITPQSGIRFGVTAFPAKGEPYLAKTIDNISWGAGLKSKTVDVALPRGVLIRGRVLDVATKAPIAGVNVQYTPKGNNLNNTDDIITGWQCMERTGEDGAFQISVLAGIGTLIVHGPRDTYVLKEMSGLELVGDRPGGDRNYANAFVPLDLASGADPQELTIEIERGQKVAGKLVDENREPIDRAVMITRLKISALHLTWRGFGDELEGGQFELSNLAPGIEYNCSFLDPRRKLGATVVLRSDTPEPIVVLKKCGTAKVRCVTSDGEARDGIHPSLQIVATPGVMRYSDETQAGELAADEDFVANFDRVNYWNGPITDSDGRVELPALIPGATYRLLGSTKGKPTHKDFTVEPGHTIDLGEIILDRE